MLDPVNSVREYSVLSNERTPAAVKGDVQQFKLEASAGAGEFARLQKLSSAHVINITSVFTGSDGTDLTSAQSMLLTAAHKTAFRSKFGYVSGSWCCAPQDEMKQGAPRSAHFSLMSA